MQLEIVISLVKDVFCHDENKSFKSLVVMILFNVLTHFIFLSFTKLLLYSHWEMSAIKLQFDKYFSAGKYVSQAENGIKV